MLIVGDVLVSDELIDKCFCCDLSLCKGACCVEGDSGAPVAPEEVADLDENYPFFQKYMTEEGVATIEDIGDTFVFEGEGEFGTPLVPSSKACAFAFFEDGVCKCAIEKAFLSGEISFRKPLSCYLYPVRVSKVGKYIALNYHHWDICKCACKKGKELNLPVYQFLKEPLIRKFGVDWYEELCRAVAERAE
ncbi:MAG: DUF3109 family protein [Bacteroidales bacterium]|nr:DUF3109 family protein [Bacteroidales bacterium]